MNTYNHITTSEHIEKATSELENLFKNIEEFEKENPGKMWGYAGIPGVLKRVRETGIDKIFFVSRDYHGRYEDDDCYFLYWDEVNKEFFDDQWSTRFAAPSYDLYEMPIYFGAAWEEGLIDKEAYLKIQKKMHLESLSKIGFDKEVAQNFNLRVSVNGGRKFKGEGYLVNVEKSSYRYATPMYRNHCDGYGLSTTYTALIWNPIDNTINRANLRYINYTDSEEIMSQYKEWAEGIINRATINDIKSNGNYNLERFDIDIDYSFKKFMEEVWTPTHVIGDVLNTAYDPEEEERKKKESEFRASKMPEIIEWVKNNTDKKGEDIIKLAIHIYNKNYGR